MTCSTRWQLPELLTVPPHLLHFSSHCCTSGIEECEPKLCPLTVQRGSKFCWCGKSYKGFGCKNHFKSWTLLCLLLLVLTQVFYTALGIFTTTDRQKTVWVSYSASRVWALLYSGEKVLFKGHFHLTERACLTALQGPISCHFSFYTTPVSAVSSITSSGLFLAKSDWRQNKHRTEYLTPVWLSMNKSPTRAAHLITWDEWEDYKQLLCSIRFLNGRKH